MTAFCDPDWIRTNDPQLRRLMLYPTELPDQYFNNIQERTNNPPD